MDTSLGADPRPWPFCPQSGGSSSLVIPLWEEEGHQDSPDEPQEVPAGPLALHWSEGLERKAGKGRTGSFCVFLPGTSLLVRMEACLPLGGGKKVGRFSLLFPPRGGSPHSYEPVPAVTVPGLPKLGGSGGCPGSAW